MKILRAYSNKWGQKWLVTVHCIPTNHQQPYAFLHILVIHSETRQPCIMLPLTTENKRWGCWGKKKCWLLMALGAVTDRAMKWLSNVLLHHENEAERGERVFVPPRSIVPRWFYYEVEKSLIISLLNSCVSKVIGGYNNNNWDRIVF